MATFRAENYSIVVRHVGPYLYVVNHDFNLEKREHVLGVPAPELLVKTAKLIFELRRDIQARLDRLKECPRPLHSSEALHWEPPDLVSIGEAARLSGWSQQTLRRMAERGDLQGAQKTPGGHWRLPREMLRNLGSSAEASRAEPEDS